MMRKACPDYDTTAAYLEIARRVVPDKTAYITNERNHWEVVIEGLCTEHEDKGLKLGPLYLSGSGSITDIHKLLATKSEN